MFENQFIYPNPKGSKLNFFCPLGAGVNEEPERSGARRSQNQWVCLTFLGYIHETLKIWKCCVK
jgi:hypothetical protein